MTLLAAGPLVGQHYDARKPLWSQKSLTAADAPSLKALGRDVIGDHNPVFGIHQSLMDPTGPLATSLDGSCASGLEFAQQNAASLGLGQGELRRVKLVDRVESISGASHCYYGQMAADGLEVFNARLSVHLQGSNLSLINNTAIPLASSLGSKDPEIPARAAVEAVATFLNIPIGDISVVSAASGRSHTTTFEAPGFADDRFDVELMRIPVGRNDAPMVWAIRDVFVNGGTLVTALVAAERHPAVAEGELWTLFNHTLDGTYRVYEQPTESPIHTTPLPPSDARVLVVNPEDGTASPNGWFDAGTTLMDGNNVHACADRNGNNGCDTPEPTCGGQTCDFSINLSGDPSTYTNASIANLFYWNNTIHDIQYQYGFDEQGGNFQENNFGRGGAGSDSVNADAQDNANGSSRCNANFATPSDGGNPRMQMFVCNNTSPQLDGSLDNGVIVHEYGHGISIRQVGGPSTSCLNNSQQAGEGWSDWHALAYTGEVGDAGTDVRGVGAYLFGEGPTGTIRPQNYSTNPAVNNYTYESISGLSVPHGVGSVWAQVAWEMYWALVDKHGFEGDLLNFDINDPAEAGNKRAFFYINEGLKNTSCQPTFVANRNGVITAAENSFGGADVCDLWEVFAAFGLGTDAVSGGSNSTNPTNGFALPPECDGSPPPPPPPPAACPDGSTPLHAADFESGAGGWSQGADTCTTGSFVVGSPTQVTAGGVTTQAAGGADGTANAFFTAPNSAAGTNDVDGGTCEALSPVVNASGQTSVEVFLSYFHGQRDAGDDANDGFSIEVLNNGSVVDTPVSIGDVANNAVWTSISTTIGSPGNVQLRVRATDGAGPGDLVEAGVDQVLICPSDSTPPPPPPPPACTVDDDFEGGAAGWVNDGASTCTTGAYVLGTPTQVVNGGVTTQVGGANSGVNALFTAVNTAAGTNDVDGGNCILRSPTFNVSAASTLSIAHFHGQRDAGDDPGGDFFSLEVSTNGGSTFTTIASNGDSTSNAVWSTSNASIPAGSDVVVRVQCSDGAGPGDLIECGIDDISICSN